MTVLVTGGGGFIGSHLVEKLARSGEAVRAMVHYNSQGSWGHLDETDPDSLSQIEACPGDITDAHFVRALVEGCDVVYHLAALIAIPYSYQAPASYVATNVVGTLNVLEACRLAATKRVVVTSTSEVYGTARYTPMDEGHPLQAQSPYAATKIAADKLAESYFRSFELPVVVLRPFNTYGPRQSARAVIPTILTQLLARDGKISLGNLEPRRDLTFVEDTTEAFVLAARTAGIEGETIHVGQGTAVSVAELAERCLAVTGVDASILSVPERERPPASEVELLLCNPAKAQRLLGWAPRVSLDEGLERAADYIRRHIDRYRTESYVL